MPAIIPASMETTVRPIDSPVRALRWYLTGFIAIPILVLGFTAWAATQPWFMQHDNHDFARVMGYSLWANGQECRILIYGDSTAMAGLDPSLIQARTGLRTCNISEIRPVQDMVGVSFPLDQYLSRHPAPVFLVTSWTPATFNFDRPRMFDPNQDGYLYAFQYDRGLWLLKGAVAHPSATLSFLNWALSGLIEDASKALVGKSMHQVRPDPGVIRERNGGMFTFTNVPEQRCSKPDSAPPTTRQDNERAVSAFRRRYETNGTHVIVDVSPIADCVPDLDHLRSLTPGIVDNEFSTMPVRFFDVDNTHLVRAGAERYSEKVAGQILFLMHSGDDAQPGRSAGRSSANSR